ncbi:unnamed protein product [Soboliphyme baturini]|uniref:DUF155 domain-containing protein n=1 Tax=Soboliphyme baturini TaxID=241478 RepID=A0A183J8E3_9BILA|nr:unnamed protein product [Soboliphyme baturini]
MAKILFRQCLYLVRRQSGSVARKEFSGKSDLKFSSKARPPKRSRVVTDEATKFDWNIWGYATCEEYQLNRLVKKLKDDEQFDVSLVSKELSNVITVKPLIKFGTEDLRRAFVFGEGVIIFWDFTLSERTALLEYIKPFEESGYDQALVQKEEETLKYCVTSESKSEFVGETFCLKLRSPEQEQMDMFAVSNAVAVSVKVRCLVVERFTITYDHKLNIELVYRLESGNS